MPCTRLRDKLRNHEVAFGCWTGLTDPAVVEIIAHAGYDYVNIDLEHSPIDTENVAHMLRAAQACGISALVRVPEGDEGLIARVADMAPDGIYMPHIADAAAARHAVSLVKYAPLGNRGASQHSRVARYGAEAQAGEMPAMRRAVNEHLIVWAQIEEKSAIDDIAAIAATPGIDVCGIAPHDLARALGCAASADEPALMEGARRVAAAVRQSGRCYLSVPQTVFGLPTALAMGAQLINIADAAGVMMAGLRERCATARSSNANTKPAG